MSKLRDREGYHEMLGKFLRVLPPEETLQRYKPEERLAGLAPEERLAGLAPEERLAGLTRKQQILALPREVLRGLTEEYIHSVPQDLQGIINDQLHRSGKFFRVTLPEDVMRHFTLEERLAGLSLQERLTTVAPGERLAGLTREQQLLALPLEILRGLSDEYIHSLPQDLQQAIRERLGQGK